MKGKRNKKNTGSAAAGVSRDLSKDLSSTSPAASASSNKDDPPSVRKEKTSTRYKTPNGLSLKRNVDTIAKTAKVVSRVISSKLKMNDMQKLALGAAMLDYFTSMDVVDDTSFGSYILIGLNRLIM